MTMQNLVETNIENYKRIRGIKQVEMFHEDDTIQFRLTYNEGDIFIATEEEVFNDLSKALDWGFMESVIKSAIKASPQYINFTMLAKSGNNQYF